MNELPRTSMALTIIVFRVEKIHCYLNPQFPCLTAQPHQNIANGSDWQINDTDKRAYSHIHPLGPVSLLHGVYVANFHFPD